MDEANTTLTRYGDNRTPERKCKDTAWTYSMLEDDHQRRLRDLTKKINERGPFFGVLVSEAMEIKDGTSVLTVLVAMFCNMDSAKAFSLELCDYHKKTMTATDPHISVDVSHEPPFIVSDWCRAKLFDVTLDEALVVWKTVFSINVSQQIAQ